MARFEITNYGKNLHFPYKGKAVFLYRNHTQSTDDEKLASIASSFQYVSVTERETPLREMKKRELVAKARSLGIPSAANKTKAQLREEIESFDLGRKVL